MSASSITNSLLLELDKTDNVFNRWAKQQQEWWSIKFRFSLNLSFICCILSNRLSNNSKNYDQCLNECDTTINALKEHSTTLDSKKVEYDNICAQHSVEIEKAKHYGDVLLQNKQVFNELIYCLKAILLFTFHIRIRDLLEIIYGDQNSSIFTLCISCHICT